jgi:hypothetical protein
MTNEANIDINIDDSAIDQLTRSLDALTRALNDTASEFNQAERQADDLEKDLKDLKGQADRTERSMAALGTAAAGIGAGIVAGAAAFELAKVSIEAFAETNERAAARLGVLRTAGQELLGEFGNIILGGEQFEEVLEALTQSAEILTEFVQDNSEALSDLAVKGIQVAVRGFFTLADGILGIIQFFSDLDENMLLLEASFLDLKVGVLEFAQDAERGIADFVAGAIEKLADLIDAGDNVFEAIVDNPAFRALFGFEEGEFEGPATFVANSLRDMADTIRGGEFDRFEDNIDRAASRAEDLRSQAERTVSPIQQIRNNLAVAEEETLAIFENLDQITARPIEVEVEVRGAGGAGAAAGGRAAEQQRISEAFQQMQNVRLQAALARQEIENIYQGSKLAGALKQGTVEGLAPLEAHMVEISFILGDMLRGIAGEDALERYVQNISAILGDAEDAFELQQRLMQKHQRMMEDVPFLEIHQEYSRQLNETGDNFNTVIGFAEALGASEERILQIEQRRLQAQREIQREYREAIDLAEAQAQALKFDQMFDMSGMRLSGLGRTLAGELRELQGIDPVIDSVEDLKRAFDALPERVARVAREAGMSFQEILKAVDETNNALRATFAQDAFKGFQDLFIRLGQTIGDALGAGLEEGETAGDRAKKFLAQLLGDFLQTIGSTAIAQGAIVAFGDPLTGGLPNPGRAAGLIAAGTAAVVAGAALSGAASKIGGARQGPTDPGPGASFGAGGGGGAAEQTTNIFIENRFGNRFDARELDRAAADSFARAASAGQA